MFFSSLVLAASLAVQSTFAHRPKPASGSHQSLEAQLHKRADPVITSGATGLGDGQIHSRLEIGDLASRADQWSLYIRTMARWQQVGPDDVTGYFGIAGIHGVPHKTWDGVERCDSCGGADGYCTHSSVHFPAWHRAYLALYEQELLKVAADVAATFDGDFGTRMQAAAQVLRIPYWDWAANPNNRGDVLPPTVAARQVTIAGPNGPETIDNPLHHFSYPDDVQEELQYTPFTDWKVTLRHPTSNAGTATSQEPQVVTAFNQLREKIQGQVYGLLTNCDDYLHFATDAGSSPKCPNSIEGIHNTVHTTCGGASTTVVSGGHMSFLPLASFDPAFWIHHANIDRLFALWQTLHPQSYGAVQTAPHATWTIALGSNQDANSPLKPFRKDADNFWTTNDVRDWSNTFKYTYPEFAASDGSQDAIANYVNNMYGSNGRATAGAVSAAVELNENGNAASRTERRHTTSLATRDHISTSQHSSSGESIFASGSRMSFAIGPINMSAKLPPFGSAGRGSAGIGSAVGGSVGIGSAGSGSVGIGSAGSGSVGTGSAGIGSAVIDPRFVAPNGSEYQYMCNVQTPRYAFNGSYTVYVFDGQPSSSDPSAWLGDSNCIGVIGVLAGGQMTHTEILSAGSVPITSHLQKVCKAGGLQDLSERHVTPYMAKNLNWKIVYAGAEVHPHALSNFQSSFWSGSSTPAGVGLLPKWSNLVPNVDVTRGKAGGAQTLADAIGHENCTGAAGCSSPSEPSTETPTSGSPTVTPAPSYSACPQQEQEEEEAVTVTVYATEYETVCACPTESTSTPAATPTTY